MSLLGPWLAFPVVALALCLGAGLLVERASGTRLPVPLLFGLGFATLVVVTQLTTYKGSTAGLTVPAVVVVGLAGYAVSLARVRALRLVWPPIALGVATYLIYAAPALLTGARTFLGYPTLGDVSIHFELIDRLLHHGRDLTGFTESSYASSVFGYLDGQYPVGSHGVLAALVGLLGVDVPWLFQPYLSVLAVLSALALEPLAAVLTRRRWLSAAGAGLAAQASLVYAYATQQEAIKELATVTVVVVLVALVPHLLAAGARWRAAIPLAVATGGALGVLSLAAAPWVGPTLLIAVAILAFRHARSRTGPFALEVIAFSLLGIVFALPSLAHLGKFVAVTKGVLTAATEFGNLQHPLQFTEVFGVWPVKDFRDGMPPTGGLAIALTGAAAILAVLGAISVLRRGAWPVVLLAAVSLIAFAAIAPSASPWAYGKSLMILSPAVVLVAAAGAIGLAEARRRTEAVVLGGALAIGLLWSNALAYHGADTAPHERMTELAAIGDRFAGQGPLVYTEFEEQAKYMLRRSQPTGVAEALRPGWPFAYPGREPSFGWSSDIGDFTAASVREHFHLIVQRTGPRQSRPPVGYSRAFHGRYYEVWKLDASAPRVLGEIPLGTRYDAAAEPRCGDVSKLAAQARLAGGQLAYVERPAVVTLRPARFGLPTGWGIDGADPDVIRPVGQGRINGRLDFPAGTYDAWLEASVTRPTKVLIDRKPVGTLEDALSPRRSATWIGRMTVAAGRHRVDIETGPGGLAPGNGGSNRLIGPAYFTPAADPGAAPVKTLDPSQWRRLCGRHLDWIEATA